MNSYAMTHAGDLICTKNTEIITIKLKCKKNKKEHCNKKIYLHCLYLSREYSTPLSSMIHSFLPLTPSLWTEREIDFQEKCCLEEISDFPVHEDCDKNLDESFV